MSLEECSSSRRSTPKHVSCKNFKHLSSGTKQIGVSKERENRYNTYIYTYRYRKREREERVRTIWSLKSGKGAYSGHLSPIRRRRVLQALIAEERETMAGFRGEGEREMRFEEREGFAGFSARVGVWWLEPYPSSGQARPDFWKLHRGSLIFMVFADWPLCGFTFQSTPQNNFKVNYIVIPLNLIIS